MTTESALRAMLFDLDGTLADTDPLHYQTWRERLASYGISLLEADFRARISGRLNPEIVRSFLPDLPEAEVLALGERKEADFRALATRLSPTPGLGALLALASARGLKVGLVTNAPRENAEHLIHALGLDQVFHTVVVGGEAARGKPDPAPYQLALSLLGVAAEHTLAFEDSPAGITAARGAGILTVGIAAAHAKDVLLAAGAALVVPDFASSELATLIAALAMDG